MKKSAFSKMKLAGLMKKFLDFSVLVAQLTGFQISRKNTADMKIQQSTDSKLVKYISILLLLVLLMHGTT